MTTSKKVVAIVVPDDVWLKAETHRDRGQTVRESNSSLYLRIIKAGLEKMGEQK